MSEPSGQLMVFPDTCLTGSHIEKYSSKCKSDAMKFTETELTYLSGLQMPVPSGWAFSTDVDPATLFASPQSESDQFREPC